MKSIIKKKKGRVKQKYFNIICDLVVISCQSWVIFFHYQINGHEISEDFEMLVTLITYVSDHDNDCFRKFVNLTHNMLFY